ncbi:hypothetical protein V2L05_22755 [Pseudomonas alliivorans]|nr:hypothetical protein [Pseudomonas alliivorans]
MKFFKTLVFVFSVLSSFNAISCVLPESKAFPAVTAGNAAITFDFVPIDDETGSAVAEGDKQVGIDINLFDCKDGSKKLMGQLPFLADTGKVKAAFFANIGPNNDRRLFVIHGVEIRSDTGERYSGDYYTVQVYKPVNHRYVEDDKLSGYFGYGADVLDKDNKIVYAFPYKTEKSVVSRLGSKVFDDWRTGAYIKLKVNKKTYIHNSPVASDITKMYLIIGDEVEQKAMEAGWVSIVYTSAKGKKISGWVLCADLDKC